MAEHSITADRALGSGTVVAGCGPGCKRQHGRHPPALAARGEVAHGVDSPVDPVQPTGPPTFEDRLVAQAGVSELVNGHDAVLARRDPRYPNVRRGAFFRHILNKAPGTMIRPLKQLIAGRPKERRSAILRISLAPWARGFLL